MTNIAFNIARICHSQFKWNSLNNKKLFLNFVFHFCNLNQILNLLNKRTIVIANVFPKLHTVKILVRPLSKKRRFRTGSDSQHVEASAIFRKAPREHFYHVFPSLSGKLIRKMSPPVLREILGVFVNILTPVGKYPVQDSENLLLPIQMELS